MRLEALKAMTVQISKSKNSQSKLDQCVVNETNSDTHTLDISGVASGVINYANALRREVLIKRRTRKAAATGLALSEARRASPAFRTFAPAAAARSVA